MLSTSAFKNVSHGTEVTNILLPLPVHHYHIQQLLFLSPEKNYMTETINHWTSVLKLMDVSMTPQFKLPKLLLRK